MAGTEGKEEEMIVLDIKLDLVSAVFEERSRNLGRIVIHNVGKTDELSNLFNYEYVLYKFGDSTRFWKTGVIKGFDRINRGSYDLLQLVLNHALGERNDIRTNKSNG